VLLEYFFSLYYIFNAIFCAENRLQNNRLKAV